jgi:hypothetical protein
MAMPEFFIVANSFAAPFVSDESTHFVGADCAAEAMLDFIQTYDHPCGLFSANLYRDANAFHKKENPLHIFRSKEARER